MGQQDTFNNIQCHGASYVLRQKPNAIVEFSDSRAVRPATENTVNYPVTAQLIDHISGDASGGIESSSENLIAKVAALDLVVVPDESNFFFVDGDSVYAINRVRKLRESGETVAYKLWISR